MKRNNIKLFAESTKKTVIKKGSIESIHLSLVVKCEKQAFEHYIRESAKLLTNVKLDKVKNFSISFEILD
jgi:hypothetical protein